MSSSETKAIVHYLPTQPGAFQALRNPSCIAQGPSDTHDLNIGLLHVYMLNCVCFIARQNCNGEKA